MKVRRFTASSMQKALKTVRDEMGPDAVILSNHRVKGGVEIIVAQNYEPVSARKSAPIYDAENHSDDSHLPSPKFSNYPDAYDNNEPVSQSVSKKQQQTKHSDTPWPFLSEDEQKEVKEQLRLQAQLEELKQQRAQEDLFTEKPAPQAPSSASQLDSSQLNSKQDLQQALENMKQQRQDGNNITALPPALSQLDQQHSQIKPTDPRAAKTAPEVKPVIKADKSKASLNHENTGAHQDKKLLDDVRNELNDLKELLQNGLGQAEPGTDHKNHVATHGDQTVQAKHVLHTAANFTWKEFSPSNALQAKLWNRFDKMGFEDWISYQLVHHLNGEEDEKKAWQACLHDLVQHMSISPSDRLKRGGIYALVGPTGAGKTTTIAKMAVRYTIEHDDAKVGLITMDNYRLAAHDQLRTLGQILGVPVAIADHEHTLEKCLQDLHDCDLVLIDTAGLTPEHPMMKYQLEQLAKLKPQINTLLTLPATSNSRVLRKVYHNYSGAALNGCILTKTDEASSLGDALSVLLESPLGLSYVTNGQHIPDDIHVADAKDIIKQAVQLAKEDSHPAMDNTVAKQAAGAW